MRIIAHRANLFGPVPLEENEPSQIEKAISLGFDVEIDVRIINDEIFLGHDIPQYKIELEFLTENAVHLWCHAKNAKALDFLLEHNLHTFWHQEDDYTITSRGIAWAYPDKQTKGVFVMPEWKDTIVNRDAYGVCTDYPYKYRESLL